MPLARVTAALLLATAGGCVTRADTCGDTAAAALQTCLADHTARQAACYADDGAACAPGDAALMAALDALSSAVDGACITGDVGYVDAAALPERFRRACASEAVALAWRAYGGPQGAALDGALGAAQTCLTTAQEVGGQLLVDELGAVAECAAEACGAEALTEQRAALRAAALRDLTDSCGDLGSLVARSPEAFVADTSAQVDCLSAAAYGDRPDLSLGLTCGPSHAQIDPTRGVWTEVILDSAYQGTRCGDGSEFAFWVRPAPEGQPLDRVVVALQGGGVCLFEQDCSARQAVAPQLFSALDFDDRPIPVGIASDDPAVSPVHDWTFVYVPYCTQDVFAGGGVSEELGAVTVERYGSVNLRAAVRIVRDWLWREVDRAGGDGFRSDRVTALFGGFSAGGYGTLYNYHWFLDDLLWPRTAAFPDGGLAVDNGELLGVGSLGEVKIPAWGMRELLPSYCFEGPCSGGETLLRALSPRLQQVPEQNMILLSNQLDSTQAADAFFSDDASFLNALRQMYCDTRELPGVHWYLTGVSDESVHVVSLRDELLTGEVDGGVMADVLLQAVTDPRALRSYVEEGDFVDAVPGVEPFPCELP